MYHDAFVKWSLDLLNQARDAVKEGRGSEAISITLDAASEYITSLVTHYGRENWLQEVSIYLCLNPKCEKIGAFIVRTNGQEASLENCFDCKQAFKHIWSRRPCWTAIVVYSTDVKHPALR